MDNIAKQTLLDSTTGAELDIETRYVVRTVPVPTRMKVPLYRNGELIPAEELAELGLTIRNYTQEEVDAQTFAGYYAANPALAARVRQYAALLQQYGLDVSATSDDINAAIMASDASDADKTAAAAGLLALIHDIEINFNEVSGDGLTAWSVLDKLIRYLPSDESDGADQSDNESEAE